MPMTFETQVEIDLLFKELGNIGANDLRCANCLVPLYVCEKIHRVPVLGKRALNIPVHSDGISPISYLCDDCKKADKPPLFVFHKEKHHRQRIIHLNVEDMPDIM
jgi:hypothetical protein